MNHSPTATGAAQRVGAGAGRIVRAWRAMPHERRLAAFAAIGLFLTLFLPWYQETVIAPGKATNLQSASATLTGWGAFSFVEAAVLLVAAGVLTLLFQRAEGRAFHLPGGDGWVITAAGLWTCVLVVWRIFDKQGTNSQGRFATTSGIEWGIFVALAVAAFLAYCGSRIRAAHQPEPPLPGEEPPAADPSPPGASGERPVRRRPGEVRPVRPPRPVRAAELPVSEPDDPPTLELPPASRRASAPERRPVRADEQLTIPLEERANED